MSLHWDQLKSKESCPVSRDLKTYDLSRTDYPRSGLRTDYCNEGTPAKRIGTLTVGSPVKEERTHTLGPFSY